MAEQSGISNKDFQATYKYLNSKSEFSHKLHEPSEELFDILGGIRILVVGAGGLGCEILKDLACIGFKNIDIIDMDTIDLSNLNRQFLFKMSDIGKPKAVVAVESINERIEGNFIAHFCSVQEKELNFYKNFDAIIAGLDSIEARRYVNAVVHKLLEYDENNKLDITSQIPLIDGGSEGFKGHCRIVIPGDKNIACLDCNLDLYPPQVNFPLCTIANTPRLPEHCVEYTKIVSWENLKPFGEETSLNCDNVEHVNWIFEQAKKRSDAFNIKGVTYRLTLGVIKNIIPAVATTNAVIAAMAVNECFKLVTFCHKSIINDEESDSMNEEDEEDETDEFDELAGKNTNILFNQADSVYTFKFPTSKNENCLVCSKNTLKISKIILKKASENTISELIEKINEKFLFNNISVSFENGKIIYSGNLKFTEENLEKKCKEVFGDMLVERKQGIEKEMQKTESIILLVSSKSLTNSVKVEVIFE